jgi:hypothetical protein
MLDAHCIDRMDVKPKPRWFKYGCGAAAAIFISGCVYVGWQWRIVQARADVQSWAERRGAKFSRVREVAQPVIETGRGADGIPYGILGPPPISGGLDPRDNLARLRRLLGDWPRASITFPSECWTEPAFSTDEESMLERTFPEADFWSEL